MQGATALDRPGSTSLRAGYLGTVPTVALGDLLIQLGLTPVTAALPALSGALSVSPAEGAWVLTAFLLPLASGLLVAGRLGDLLGYRRVFLIGVGLYALATAACGLASSLLALVLARAFQGAGAALISGNNLAIVTAAVAPERRGRMLGLVAMISSLGAVAGVGLGTVVSPTNPHPPDLQMRSTKPDGSRPTEWNHPASVSADRGMSCTAISNRAKSAKLDGSAQHEAVNR